MAIPEVVTEYRLMLTDQATVVQSLREIHVAIKEQLAYEKQAWERQHADLISTEAQLAEQVRIAETRLRQLALTAFNITGERKPGPGVVVKMFTKVSYDADKALDWARENARMVIVPESLDAKGFEAMAKMKSFIGPATLEDVPQAQIATNLQKALREAEDAT